MAVYLTRDNRELAQSYDEISDSQYQNGLGLLERLAVKPGDTVLDIGSGTGRLGRYVSGLVGPSGRYVGIDPLEERIRIAKEKNTQPNAIYQIGSAEELSGFADNTFDVIYLNAVFHWVTRKSAALREIYRVLKPKGLVGITTGAKELGSVTRVQVITDQVLKQKPYREQVNINEATLRQHGLTTTKLIELLIVANLTVKNIEVKSVDWHFTTARDLVQHQEASSFGNYLSHVPETLRVQAKSDIEAELNKYTTPEGIQVTRYTIFAIAQKAKGFEAN